MNNFSVQKVFFTNDGTRPMKKGKMHIYEYSADDMVWYRDTDEVCYMDVPKNGEKVFTLKAGYHARICVKMLDVVNVR